MSTFRASILMLMAVLALSNNMRAVSKGLQKANQAPALSHTCLITGNVKRLVEFYEPVLERKAKWSGDDYAEFSTAGGTLAIFSAAAQEKYIPGSAESQKNRSVILEFRIVDPDREYKRLQSLVKTWVKPPTTQPWGTRSLYFRDPDGNLVNFYSVVTMR